MKKCSQCAFKGSREKIPCNYTRKNVWFLDKITFNWYVRCDLQFLTFLSQKDNNVALLERASSMYVQSHTFWIQNMSKLLNFRAKSSVFWPKNRDLEIWQSRIFKNFFWGRTWSKKPQKIFSDTRCADLPDTPYRGFSCMKTVSH